MTMKQVEEEYKKLMDEIEASKELNDSITWWKNRYEAQVKINEEHQRINSELRKEIDGLVTVIDLVREYINKYLEEHVIEDQPDEQSIFCDEEGYYIPNAKEQLLEILERVNKE